MNRPFLTLLFCLMQVVAFGQDLIITEVTGSTSYARYEEFTTTLNLKNNGIVDINLTGNGISNDVYLSVDNVFDRSTDLRIGYTPSRKALSAGGSETLSCYCDLDVPPGTYYLVVKVDIYSAVTETDEDNNLFFLPGFIIQDPDVDWQFTLLSNINTTTYVNDNLYFDYHFKNNGLTNVGGYIYNKFYLSDDNVLDDSDIVLMDEFFGSSYLGGPDIFEDEYANINIPNVPAGQYYIIGKLDDPYSGTSEFNETNEDNNTIVSEPITVEEADADLEIVEIVATNTNSSISGAFTIKNNGSTGVGSYSIAAYLSSDPIIDWGVDAELSTMNFYQSHNYIWGNDTRTVSFYSSFISSPPGDYYLITVINPDNSVVETDVTNNEYVSMITIEPPPVPSIVLSDGSFIGAYDNTDTELNLTLNFTSKGTGYYSDGQYYEIKIKDATNAVVFSTTKSQLLFLAEDESQTHDWLITMDEPLPIGNYTFEISCSNSFDCYTNDYTLPLIVDQAVNFLTGNIQGEDGTPITKGKLFLYQKDDFGVVKFINKVVPTSGSEYSFQLDSHQHTLYFIPDRILFPDYVPTILGKTMTLNESSFITIPESTDRLFEILKIVPLAVGNMSLSGNISSGAATPNGRSSARVATTSVASLPVILLSASGDPVAITETDGTGYYEFNNLPSGNYQLLVSFELDQTLMEAPIAVDITSHSAKVDLIIGTENISSVSIKLQEIVFDALPVKNFSDSPFDLNATSTSGLPVSYTSDNPAVVTISGSSVTITGAGSAIITAHQNGNTGFQAATPIQQTLTINKASQSITFDALSEKTTEDISFELTAAASSGLAVSYASSNTSVATINGNVVTILTPGTTSITASQAGNSNYNAAAPVIQKLTIKAEKTSQQIIFAELPVKSFNDPSFTLDARATSGLAVSYTSNNNNVATVIRNKVVIKAPGTTIITAMQAGNNFYEAATPVAQQLTIDKADQVVSFGGIPQTVSVGSNSFILGASSSSGLPVSYSSTNTSVATININTVTIVGPGWVEIIANQSGNELYKEAKPVSRALYVSRELQTIAFDELPEKSVDDETFTLDATASSGLPVVFTSSDTRVATIVNNQVTIVGPGETIITATQAGDETYEPISVSQTLLVNMVTAVDEVADENVLSAYPNPVATWLTISSDGFALNQALSVSFFDSHGRVVLNQEKDFNNMLSFDLSLYPQGIYTICIVQGTTVKRKRVVKY